MELNSLLFPAPSTKYSAQDLEGEILYVPRFYRFNQEFTKLHLKQRELGQKMMKHRPQ